MPGKWADEPSLRVTRWLVPGTDFLADRDETARLFNAGRAPWGMRVTLLKCPVCDGAIVAEQMLMETDGNGDPIWSFAERCWPGKEKYLDVSIPPPIRVSLEEAQTCLAAGAFAAPVVMSGRSITSDAAIWQSNAPP